MVVKLLGGFDLFTGVVFWIWGIINLYFGFNILPGMIISTFGIVLLMKGLFFTIGGDMLSIIDIIIGFVIIFSVTVQFPFVIITASSIFLIQKGIFSFLA